MVNLQTGLKVDEIPFGSYPRPQLVRDSYISLNGKWDNGILVPFPLESSLSGYKGKATKKYDYTREFEIPAGFNVGKVLLHFQAVDQICKIYVDDNYVCFNEGGYLPFEVDITKYSKPEIHTLKVSVTDKLSHVYPWGKQKKKRGGMWYTPVTGIWQSVWLESVPEIYIENVTITPHIDSVDIEIKSEAEEFIVEVYEPSIGVRTGKEKVIFETAVTGKKTTVKIDTPMLWTPETPFLYGLKLKTALDEVTSYFALRTVSIGYVGGKQRILLNNKPIFIHAVLDQGYYPEGIFLPNNELGYENDILEMKKLGFNALRKHIKIEPECFYEACDRLGMLVLQDMVNNGNYNFLRDTALPTIGFKKRNDKLLHLSPKSRRFFIKHMLGTLLHLYNHPSIIYYTLFNEGWGQFKSDMIYETAATLDHTRIIDSTSGWFAQKESDVVSEHVYFHSIKSHSAKKPIVVSECGGFSYKEDDHVFNPDKTYGYGEYGTKEELTDAVVGLYKQEVVPYIDEGLCGCVYTQLSDVEDEINGFLTYDRKICKVDTTRMRELSGLLQSRICRDK